MITFNPFPVQFNCRTPHLLSTLLFNKLILFRASVGLVVFDKYMKLVRKLQSTYRMEPAGSQGVWSLDDYQFVVFIWGAAQMVGHGRIKPKSISDYDIADMLAPDYHFFSCIKVNNI